MSGSEVDLDRLADYAAGLLDPAESAEVERLVATERAWADTLTALSAAQPLVQEALAGLASPPVPDDVLARLDSIGSGTTAGASVREPAADTSRSAADSGASVVHLSDRSHGRRRRTGTPAWMRPAAAVAAVAASAAVCVAGVQLLRAGQSKSSSSGSAAAVQDNRAKAPALSGSSSVPLILVSGNDYTSQTVTSAASAGASNGGMHAEAQPENPALGAPTELARLGTPTELNSCLVQVRSAHGGIPRVVDFARYQGQPALVVVLSGAGTGEVVVVGSKCGLPGSGTDQIYATPLR